MKIRNSAALLAGIALAASTPAFAAKKEQPVAAPAGAVVVAGVGIANPQALVQASSAFRTALQQRPVTYKPQYDQAQSRAAAIQAQLKPLADKFEADRKAAKPDQAALAAQYRQIQQIQQAGQEEINGILAPAALSEAYVDEQINEQLTKAIGQAAAKKKISLVLTPENVIFAESAYNLNQDILNELNVLLPSAQLVPPTGWMPRAQREQQAAQQAAQQPQQPAKPTEGR